MTFLRRYKVLSMIAVLLIVACAAVLRNLSNEDMIRKLQKTGMDIQPVLGEDLITKREYFASHSSFIFLILTKVMASKTIQKETYQIAFGGPSAAKEAVDKMPPEEVGFILNVDGVPIELTRYPSEGMPVAVALMMDELLKKDFIHAQCDDPRYEYRMTCSRVVYLPKKNYLIAVSNIDHLTEIYDDNGRRVARDYEPIPEERFQKVLTRLKSL